MHGENFGSCAGTRNPEACNPLHLELHPVQQVGEEPGLIHVIHFIGHFIVAPGEDIVVVGYILQVDKELLGQAPVLAVELEAELHIQSEIRIVTLAECEIVL